MKKIDLKNINFSISHDDVAVFKFLTENEFQQLYNVKPVVSVVSDSTYGRAYFVDDKIVFCKHKAIEINKGKQPPKVCSTIQKTCKIISQEEYDKYFRETASVEICALEMMEEKLLWKK